MKYRLTQNNNIITIDISGDLVSVDKTIIKILNEFSNFTNPKILISFHETNLIDSYTFGILVTGLMKITEKGGKVNFAGLSPFLLALFESLKMDAFFGLYKSAEIALNNFD